MPKDKPGKRGLTLSAPRSNKGAGLTLSTRTTRGNKSPSGLTLSARGFSGGKGSGLRLPQGNQPSRGEVRRALAEQSMPSTSIGEQCTGLAGLSTQLEEQEAEAKAAKARQRLARFGSMMGHLYRMLDKLQRSEQEMTELMEAFDKKLGEAANLDPKSRGKKGILQEKFKLSRMEHLILQARHGVFNKRYNWIWCNDGWYPMSRRPVKSQGINIPLYRDVGGEAHEHFIQDNANNETEDPSDMIPGPTIDSPKEEDVETVIFVCEQTVEEFWRTQMSA